MLYRWHEYYNELVCKVAQETGAFLIDLRTPFLKSHKLNNLICSDGIHPSETGHLMIEKIIEDEYYVRVICFGLYQSNRHIADIASL
jgi:lysophospholipase L1-like esterase